MFQSRVLPIKTTKNVQLLVFVVAEKSKARANKFISFLLANILEKQQYHQGFFRIFSQSNFYLFSYLRRSTTITQKSISKTLAILMDGLMSKLKGIELEPVN